MTDEKNLTSPPIQKPRRRYVDPIVYRVGVDISQDHYQDSLVKIADWFAESRSTKEPALLAQRLFQECLDGVTNAGAPWFAAANATLAARVRSKCRFDIEKMVPLRTASEKRREKKEREKQNAVIRKERQKEDTLVPDEMRKALQKTTTYGDDPMVWMTTAEQSMWNQLFESYQREFVELKTISALEELKMLCDTHVLMERFRMQQLSNKPVNQTELEAVVKRFTSLKKSLGIHPDQLKTKTRGTFDSSIGEAVAKFTAMGDTFLELRKRMWLEELLQMYQMFHTRKADGSGYQLDEVGLYGLTRTKPNACPKCGTMVYGGLTCEQIEEYLIRNGALEPVEEDVNEDDRGDLSGHPGEAPPGSTSGDSDRSGNATSDVDQVAE